MQANAVQVKPKKLTRVETCLGLKKLPYHKNPEMLVDGQIWDSKEVSQYVAKSARLIWNAASAAQMPSLITLAELLFSEACALAASGEHIPSTRALLSKRDQ